MKKFLCITGFLLVVLSSAFSQEMTKDQWEEAMRMAKQQEYDLQCQYQDVDSVVMRMRMQIESLDSDVKACEDALFALQGITREQNDAYLAEIQKIERRLNELRALDDIQLLQYKEEVFSLDKRLEELAKTTFALVPRYGEKINELHAKVESLIKSLNREKWYVVRSWSKYGDCLWNIAKQKDIYDNAHFWSKIWLGNKGQIKNPDLIQPGWKLRIPEGAFLTDEEKKAAARHARERAEASSSESGAHN